MIPAHQIRVALLQPQIAPNTGNIARSCVATGTELHLVRPLGFVLSDHNLRRSAMDYWDRLKLVIYDDNDALFGHIGAAASFWFFDSAGEVGLWDAEFHDGDWLIFGSETRGIAPEILRRHPHRTVRIPQVNGERCLNVSTAVGIALYAALHGICGQSRASS